MILDQMTVECPCCGEKLEVITRKSLFVPEYGMDQKPSIERALPFFYHCANCNFSGTNVASKSGSEVMAMVSSDSYQNIWKQDDKDETEKAYLSAIKLAATPRLAADLYMCYCWYLEFKGKQAEANGARSKAVDIQGMLIAEEKNFDIMLQKMDSLRQLGRMEEALAMIADIKPLVNPQDTPELVKLLIFEKRLIVAGDIKPHFQSEVELPVS